MKTDYEDITELPRGSNVLFLGRCTWYAQCASRGEREGYIMIVKPEEWLSKPGDNEIGLLKVLMVEGEADFPILVETYNVLLEDVTIGEEQDFELLLECADKPSVYEDEAAFCNDKSTSMNFESVMPIGLFPHSGDESFAQSPHIILNGKVAITYENPIQFGFDESDVLYSFSCLGNEYDAVMYPEFSDGVQMKEGNIVSCVYRVQGWPKPE